MAKLLQNILFIREEDASCTLVGFDISGKQLDDASTLKKSKAIPLLLSIAMLKSP